MNEREIGSKFDWEGKDQQRLGYIFVSRNTPVHVTEESLHSHHTTIEVKFNVAHQRVSVSELTNKFDVKYMFYVWEYQI